MKYITLFTTLLVINSSSFSQTHNRFDSLLSGISGNSAEIINHQNAKTIMSYGVEALPTLATIFADGTITTIYSNCHNRLLKKGEIAIILADHIESIPYFSLIGLQNCMLESCPDNPNFVEYYLDFMARRGMHKTFARDYAFWLRSAERKERYRSRN
ncbi:MAG: hypothetical protein H7Y42_17415 [Chitinophagaceae bacterium]|nr:hypothetical protein [Chitinophagaceae bacterium]